MKPIRNYGTFHPFNHSTAKPDGVERSRAHGGVNIAVVHYDGFREYFYDDGQTDEEFIAEYKLQLAKFVLEGG